MPPQTNKPINPIKKTNKLDARETYLVTQELEKFHKTGTLSQMTRQEAADRIAATVQFSVTRKNVVFLCNAHGFPIATDLPRPARTSPLLNLIERINHLEGVVAGLCKALGYDGAFCVKRKESGNSLPAGLVPATPPA